MVSLDPSSLWDSETDELRHTIIDPTSTEYGSPTPEAQPELGNPTVPLEMTTTQHFPASGFLLTGFHGMVSLLISHPIFPITHGNETEGLGRSVEGLR